MNTVLKLLLLHRFSLNYRKLSRDLLSPIGYPCFPTQSAVPTLLWKIVNKIIQSDKHQLTLPIHKKATTFTLNYHSRLFTCRYFMAKWHQFIRNEATSASIGLPSVPDITTAAETPSYAPLPGSMKTNAHKAPRCQHSLAFG